MYTFVDTRGTRKVQGVVASTDYGVQARYTLRTLISSRYLGTLYIHDTYLLTLGTYGVDMYQNPFESRYATAKKH